MNDIDSLKSPLWVAHMMRIIGHGQMYTIHCTTKKGTDLGRPPHTKSGCGPVGVLNGWTRLLMTQISSTLHMVSAALRIGPGRPIVGYFGWLQSVHQLGLVKEFEPRRHFGVSQG